MPSLSHPPTAEAALADVLGSMLLVAITVTVTLALGALILAFPAPAPTLHVNLVITESPGQGGWGTGDEVIQVTHMGGMALRATTSTIAYAVNGGPPTSFSGSALGWTAGKLTVSQVWTSPGRRLAATDLVTVSVVNQGGQSQLLASLGLKGGQAA
ncbi:MAG: hypothetical protein ACYDBQ_10395 [Thermoplasmatota archaeon]